MSGSSRRLATAFALIVLVTGLTAPCLCALARCQAPDRDASEHRCCDSLPGLRAASDSCCVAAAPSDTDQALSRATVTSVIVGARPLGLPPELVPAPNASLVATTTPARPRFDVLRI